MENISLNKEAVELKSGKKYIIIDALYINYIKEEISNLNIKNLTDEIRSKVFPYTDTPFAEYIPKENIFDIEHIRKIDYDQIKDIKSVLSSDSGILVFISENLLVDFISKFDYEELVNSSTDLININYWKSITTDFNLSDVAIVVSSGIDTELEFDGGGTYKIV